MLIGELCDTEFGTEGKMHWDLFDEDITVILHEGVDIAYAEKCAEALNNLPEETVKAIWEAAKRYCLSFIALCGDEWEAFNEKMTMKVTKDTPAEDIKSQIYPSCLIVDEPEGDGIGFSLECSCSWEVEHGLEITILDNKPVYLGGFEGRCAWGKFDPDDKWNFVNNIKHMLISELCDTEFGIEGEMHWDLFDEDITVSLHEGVDIAYAEKCAEALNNLPEETVKAIWEAAKRYCLFFIALCGDEWENVNEEMTMKVTKDTPAEDIKSQIYPSRLIVDEPEGDGIGFSLECSCSWEVEHGLEITILDNKPVYLGEFEGRCAWDKFDPDDKWNFVNGIKE